ncbi:hypothetical protein B7463_g3947, partial [Scytalidium lignicola]
MHRLPQPQDDPCPPERGVRRQQSIRFAGPNAIPRRKSASTRTSYPVMTKASFASLRQGTVSEIPVTAAYRSQSRSTSTRRAASRQGPSQEYLSALDSYDVYYTPEDDVASVPSSYRRVRKSKSMFMPTKKYIPFSSYSKLGRHSTEPGRVGFLSNSTATASEGSFGDGHVSLTPETQKRNTTAVQLARDQYLYQIEQQRLKEQPTVLHDYQNQRQNKPFRRSLRNTGSFGNAITNTSYIDITTKDHSFKEKARRVSATIRSRFHRVFARNKDNMITIQDQQAGTEEFCFGDFSQNADSEAAGDRDWPHQDPATVPRLGLHPTLSYPEPSVQQQRSSMSIGIQRSDEGNDTSRITSWTSTISNALVRQESPGEGNRLSIHDEHSTQTSDLTPIHRPVTTTAQLSSPLSAPVDSARVYSALMKRLDRQIFNENYGTARDTRLKNSQHTQNSSIKRNSTSIPYPSPENGPTHPIQQGLAGNTIPGNTTNYEEILTPQEIAILNESHDNSQKESLQETKSTFFGSTVGRQLSPYRQVLSILGKTGRSTDHVGNLSNNASSLPDPDLQSSDGKESYTESVYSRTTSGLTPKEESVALPSMINDDKLQAIPDTGAAIVTSRTIYRPKHPTTPRSMKSPNTSNDWKQWMSSQVSEIETSNENESPIGHLNSPIPIKPIVSSHVREKTQINDDAVTIRHSDSPPVCQPFGLLQKSLQISPNTPITSKLQASGTSSNTRNQFRTPGERLPLQPIQLRSSFNSMANSEATAFTSFTNADTDDLKHLIQKTPQNPRKIASNISRSVERSARLRRATMKHSPSTGSVIERQSFISAGSCMPGGILSPSESYNSISDAGNTDDIYDTHGTGLMGPSPNQPRNAQQMGSKQMVDLFLSSRRRITGGSGSSFNGPAFWLTTNAQQVVMRLPLHLLCLTLSIVPSALAVFADEAYAVDYHHELLGLPQSHTTFFHRPRKDDKATLLYTLSDLGVLGAVNPGTGKIIWRQNLGAGANNSSEGFLRPVHGEGAVISALDSSVQSWDAPSGREKWSNKFDGIVKDLEVMETAAGDESAKDVLALFEHGDKGHIRRLDGVNGDVKWEFEDQDVPLQVSTNVRSVFLISLHGSREGYNVKVTVLDPVTGKKMTEYTLSTKGDVHSTQDVLLVGANSAVPIIAWADKAKKNLNVNILGKSNIQSLPLKELDGEILEVTLHAPHLIQSQPHFLVHSQSAASTRADVYHIDLTTGAIKKAYELPQLKGKGTVATNSQDANVYFIRFTEFEAILVSSASHGILGRWPVKLEEGHGDLLHAASEVVSRNTDTYAIRSALATSNEDWVLVRNGVEAWSRPEGLSGGVAATWVEIPEEEDLVKTLQAEAHSNPLSAYIHRVKRHVNDLQYLPSYLEALPKRLLSSILPADSSPQDGGILVRDNFGFNKLVIVATHRGSLYCLNAGNNGNIVWNLKAFDLPAAEKWDVRGMLADSSKGITTIKGHGGEEITVRSATGAIVDKTNPRALSLVQSTAVVNNPEGKWLLPIPVSGEAELKVPQDWPSEETLVIRGKDGEVKGLRFDVLDNTVTVPINSWEFRPAKGEKIINVISRPTHDPVASIGRVLGDRTVLYKYLNPNIILVNTVNDQKNSASFYLIDTISGDILYHVTHDKVDVTQPIVSLLTENWFTYSLWSNIDSGAASKGYQLVISEMFESETPNDRGPLGDLANFTSLQPSDIPNAEPPLPYVVAQSFIIPEAITHMSVTQTQQGITSRQLICTLASNAVIGIPRNILDARRPVGREPTAGEMEEGLIRYHPVIEFDPKMIITHKREVIGIKDVITTPALLESTSLLFAYGIDVFGTRVAPSAAFDILGRSFNKSSLIATVAALGAGVAILAPMIRRKQINMRWMTS